MVSNHFESKMSWRPIARPLAVRPRDRNGRRLPPILQKPGEKVLVYVYETPGQPPVLRAMPAPGSSGFATTPEQLNFNGYPQENGVSKLEETDTYSRMRKLRDQAEEAGEGYKLLADVDPKHFKNSSRGGRMFMKQKKRMENYTSPGYAGKVRDYETDPEILEEEQEGATPGKVPKISSKVKHIPKPIFQSKFSKRRRDQILPPLRSPPPEWRAKVESSYSISKDDTKKPIGRWNCMDVNRKKSSSRSISAPLLSEDEIYDISVEDDRQKAGSAIETNSESNNGPAVFNSEVKNQGVQNEKSGFLTKPYIQYDFNARPVGWSRAYAAQY